RGPAHRADRVDLRRADHPLPRQHNVADCGRGARRDRAAPARLGGSGYRFALVGVSGSPMMNSVPSAVPTAIWSPPVDTATVRTEIGNSHSAIFSPVSGFHARRKRSSPTVRYTSPPKVKAPSRQPSTRFFTNSCALKVLTFSQSDVRHISPTPSW